MSAAFDRVGDAMWAFTLVSMGGLWLIFNGIRGRGWIFAPGLDAPRWFLIVCGVAMQLPLVGFIVFCYVNGVFGPQ